MLDRRAGRVAALVVFADRVDRRRGAALADDRAVARPRRVRRAPLLQRPRALAGARLRAGAAPDLAALHGRGLATLVALMRILPRSVRGIGLGRVGTAVIVGMVILAAPGRCPCCSASRRCGGRAIGAWGRSTSPRGSSAQPFGLAANAVFAMAIIVLLVALAVRFPRTWWIPGGAVFVVLALLLSLASGWLDAAGHRPGRRPDAARRHPADRAGGGREPAGQRREGERLDRPGQRVRDRLGPVDARRALGHAARRPLLARRGEGGGRPRVRACEAQARAEGRRVVRAVRVPDALPRGRDHAPSRRPARPREPAPRRARRHGDLARDRAVPERRLTTLRGGGGLAGAPHDPRPGRRESCSRASRRRASQDPNPPLWAYLWLETHPTLMQRIAMAERYEEENPPG